MSEERLRQELNEAHQAIRMIQDELAETNQGLIALVLKLEQRVDQVVLQLEERTEQLAVVAMLGRQALTTGDVEDLMRDAVNAVSQTLGVKQAVVFEDSPDQENLSLRAASEELGCTKVQRGGGSLADLALEDGESVVVEDLQTETRFRCTEPFARFGARSGANVVIRGKQRPYGVLGAYAAEKRQFASEEVVFLECVAQVLASALEL